MKVNFEKQAGGLVPVIVQDAQTDRVLAFGHMDRKSVKRTRKDRKIVLLSRSGKRQEKAGAGLRPSFRLKKMLAARDGNSILIKAIPKNDSARGRRRTEFGEKNKTGSHLKDLENTIRKRRAKPGRSSRTSRLFARGINQIAKKFGEEAVELVIEAKDEEDDRFRGEAADVLYHFLVLLAERDVEFENVVERLRRRRI